MTAVLQIANIDASPKVCILRHDPERARTYNVGMAKPDNSDIEAGRNLRSWREHAGLTQSELAEKAGTTASVVSLFEAGKRQLTPQWLKRFAKPLGTDPGTLLEHRPGEAEVSFLSEFRSLSDRTRHQIIEIARTLKNSA